MTFFDYQFTILNYDKLLYWVVCSKKFLKLLQPEVVAYTPVIPALGTEAGRALCVQPGLSRKFQASQDHTVRPYLKRKREEYGRREEGREREREGGRKEGKKRKEKKKKREV